MGTWNCVILLEMTTQLTFRMTGVRAERLLLALTELTGLYSVCDVTVWDCVATKVCSARFARRITTESE
jgi:hypothetical protein